MSVLTKWLSQLSQVSHSGAGETGITPSEAEEPEKPASARHTGAINNIDSVERFSDSFENLLPAKAAKPAKAEKAGTDHSSQLLGDATKGPCWKCGQPVTWTGPLQGLRSAFGEAIHLRCPSTPPDPSGLFCRHCNKPIGARAVADIGHGVWLHHACGRVVRTVGGAAPRQAAPRHGDRH